MTIGQAGEMKLGAASIAFTDRELRPTRHCGRGGVGAVMGAKNIKAIVLDDTGTHRPVAKDHAQFQAATKPFAEGLKKHPVTGQGLPAFGTNVLTNVLNEAGGYPTFNFKQGTFDGASKISGEAQAEPRPRAAARRPTAASAAAPSSARHLQRRHGQLVTKQPEYETVWAHGGNCGITISTSSRSSTSWTTTSASTPSRPA